LKIVVLKSQKDLALLKKGDVAESEKSELLRKAAEKDVLVNPLNVKGFFRDEALIRSVGEGKGIFAIPLVAIVSSKGASRAKLLRELKNFVRLCFRLKAKFVFTNAYAKSKFDLKGKREVQGMGSLFSLTPLQAKKAFETEGREFLSSGKT
jgi:RNase P/RNase MRP subunit p30